MSNKSEEKDSGIMVFKSTFDYLIQGDLSNDDFCVLMRCIYDARWNGVFANEEDLPFVVRVIWRSLKHSIRKSIRNADNYKSKKANSDTHKQEEHPQNAVPCVNKSTDTESISKMEKLIDNILATSDNE